MDSCNEGGSDDDKSSSLVTSLISLLDGAISRDRAKELLEATNHSIERAIEHYFWTNNHSKNNSNSNSNSNQTEANNAKSEQKDSDDIEWLGTSTEGAAEPSSQEHFAQPTNTTKPTRQRKQHKSSSSSASPSKRRRVQSTLSAFVSSPPSLKSHSKTSSTIEVLSPPKKESVGHDSRDRSNDLDKNKEPPSQCSQQVVVDDEIPAANRSLSELSHKEGQPANRALTKSANKRDGPLTVPYSLVIQKLATVVDTTKRTIKLEALKSLFSEVVSFLVPSIALQDKRAKEEKLDLHEEARILHMILDLILGKISLLTVQNAPRNNDKNQKGLASSKLDVGNKKPSTTTSITLQVSGAAVSKALRVVLGLSPSSQKMKTLYRRFGDLGDVAAAVLAENTKTSVKSFFVAKKSTSKSKNERKDGNDKMSVRSVHESLQALATVPSGTGSQTLRHNMLVRLFRDVSDSVDISAGGQQNAKNDRQDVMRFLVRTVLGNMRIGATLKTVLAALAMAVSDLKSGHGVSCNTSDGKAKPQISTKSDEADRLQKVYNVCPRLNEICHALLQGGIEHAEATCSLTCGYPIEPMLANPAHSIDQVEEFIRKTGNGSCAIAEWKYDGVRCQAHCYHDDNDKPELRLFSRHLLDQTEQYPDIAAALWESADLAAKKSGRLPPVSFICDAEIVAVAEELNAPNTKESVPSFRLLPFQDLRRGTAGASSSGQVRVFCFDILYLNGESLLKVPLWRRQEIMRQHFVETSGFAFAKSTTLPALTPMSAVKFDQALLTEALKEAVDGGAEGLMVKLTGENKGNEADDPAKAENMRSGALGHYESGTRSHEWLKLKRDYIGNSEFSDTIDVVPIGAWYGNGRKAQAGFLSPVLLAVYDEDDGVFCSISRCMSFSDEMYAGMKAFYFDGKAYGETCNFQKKTDLTALHEKETGGPIATSDVEEDDASENENEESGFDTKSSHGDDMESERTNCYPSRPPSSVYSTNENPPIWFRPLEVFEVSFADLSLSRTHTAASGLLGDPEGRGIALRFPRFKRKRPDKSPTQATTTAQIAQLFYQQSKISVGSTS